MCLQSLSLLSPTKEWYPTHGKSKTQKVDADNLMPVDFDLAMGAGEVKVHQEREVLNVMDDVGSLWQISIEGSRVRVINGTPLAVGFTAPPHPPSVSNIKQKVRDSLRLLLHRLLQKVLTTWLVFCMQLPLSGPCGMSFKGEMMVSGDAEGNMVFLENSQWKLVQQPL